jgi:hypothetical protein
MNRRTFINAAGAAGLGLSGGLGVAATDPPIAGLIKVLEDSPRERIARELARLIRTGVRDEELLAALSLAAVRNVQPYPDVGYKYHSIMVLRSIAAATRHLPPADRWLPIVWAADYFKETQAEERASSGWRLAARVAPVGDRETARRALLSALDGWDREAADAAIVGYARSASTEQIFSLLFPYGARDLRAIGHKAIAVANAHSLIALLGAAQAEPILRSTVAALQNADAGPNPSTHDLRADRTWRQNQQLLRDIPPSWKQGRDDPGARRDLRAALYRETDHEVGAVLVGLLRRGISPDSIWQVLFETAAELVMHQASIVLLHAQTTANALHTAYRVCGNERTEQLMMLQGAAFIAMFCKLSGASPDTGLAALQPVAPDHQGADAIGEIFSDLSADHRTQAAGKSLAYLQGGGDAQALIAEARHHLVYNAVEAHDYKFSEAVFDNYAQLADGAWRNRYLSAGMAYFTAPAAQPAPIIAEIRELLRA